MLTGRDGKLLVDAGITASRPRITEALGSLSSDPVKHLDQFALAFRSHRRQRMAPFRSAPKSPRMRTLENILPSPRVLKIGTSPFPPSPPGALPTKLFDNEQTLHLNGSTLALKKYSPAHTDSDISVEFTDVDVIHVADTFWNGHFPFIDYSTGGSIDGMIRAAEANVARVTDKTDCYSRTWSGRQQVSIDRIPRHARFVREKVSALKKEGSPAKKLLAPNRPLTTTQNGAASSSTAISLPG